METRVPRKAAGVPKETPQRNSIEDLESILREHIPEGRWFELGRVLRRRRFFAAGMLQQVKMMAGVAAQLTGDDRARSRLIDVLASSPVEKIRGVAAFVIPIVYEDDLALALASLEKTAALEGAWPRELSATILHKMVIEHGVAPILEVVRPWTKDSNPAIRRVVTEGFRPRGVMLPHITELEQDPLPLKGLLEPLMDDPAEYVRRSVANNLNDVSKDNPAQLLDWLSEWQVRNASRERAWIIGRALRTLVDDGNPRALALLGYAPPDGLELRWVQDPPGKVVLNQLLPFELELTNPRGEDARVHVLLVMDEPGKGRGRRRSKYQLFKGTVRAGKKRHILKKVHFVDRNCQPKLPGEYGISIMLNGKQVSQTSMHYPA